MNRLLALLWIVVISASLVYIQGCTKPEVVVDGECFMDSQCQKDCPENYVCFCGDDLTCRRIPLSGSEDGDLDSADSKETVEHEGLESLEVETDKVEDEQTNESEVVDGDALDIVENDGNDGFDEKDGYDLDLVDVDHDLYETCLFLCDYVNACGLLYEGSILGANLSQCNAVCIELPVDIVNCIVGESCENIMSVCLHIVDGDIEEGEQDFVDEVDLDLDEIVDHDVDVEREHERDRDRPDRDPDVDRDLDESTDVEINPQCRGDVCADAIPIPYNGGNDSGTLHGDLTNCQNDYTGSCSAFIDMGDEVFVLNLPTSAMVTLTAQPESSSGFYPYMYIRRGSCNGTEVACLQPGLPSFTQMLDPGVYFVFVDGFGSTGSFALMYTIWGSSTDGDEDIDAIDLPDIPEPEIIDTDIAELDSPDIPEEDFIDNQYTCTDVCQKLLDCGVLSYQDFDVCVTYCQTQMSDEQKDCIQNTPCESLEMCFPTDGDIEQDVDQIDVPDVDEEPIILCADMCQKADECGYLYGGSIFGSSMDECMMNCYYGRFTEEEQYCTINTPCPEIYPRCFGITDGDEESETDLDDSVQCVYDSCNSPFAIPVDVHNGFRDEGTTSSCNDLYYGSCAQNRAPEVVYTWRLSEAMHVVIDMAGSRYDTLIYLRKGSCEYGNEIACNDDNGSNLNSRLDVYLGAGEYYLFIDGYALSAGEYVLNISFEPTPDSDNDTVPDAIDNCLNVYNPDQWDVDSDGIGDMCDNCKYAINPEQRDSDADGIGDECDPTPEVPYQCAMVECSDVYSCTQYGLNRCEVMSDSSSSVCTMECSSSQPCPRPWNCVDGMCSCNGGSPVECPVYCGNDSQCPADLPVCADVYAGDGLKECTTECSVNEDCPKGYSCYDNVCICTSLPPDMCSQHSCSSAFDCLDTTFVECIPLPSGEMICSHECASNDECMFGSQCSDQGLCICPSTNIDCTWRNNDPCITDSVCQSKYGDEAYCNGTSIVPPRLGWCTIGCENDLQCVHVFGFGAFCNADGECDCQQ